MEKQANVEREEHVGRFQGLYLIVGGGAFIIWSTTAVFWKGNEWAGLLGLFLPGLTALFVCTTWIPRYYARRFGDIRKHVIEVPREWAHWRRKLIIVGILTFPTIWILFGTLQKHAHLRVDLFSPLLLLAVPWALLVTPRSELRSTKAVTLVTVIVVGLAIVYLLPIWLSFSPALHFWPILDASFPGMVLVLKGLCDHISLTQPDGSGRPDAPSFPPFAKGRIRDPALSTALQKSGLRPDSCGESKAKFKAPELRGISVLETAGAGGICERCE